MIDKRVKFLLTGRMNLQKTLDWPRISQEIRGKGNRGCDG